MFEIILFAGVIVAFFYASSQSGKISQLKQDIDKLKKDVQALQLMAQAGDRPATATLEQTETHAASVVEGAETPETDNVLAVSAEQGSAADQTLATPDPDSTGAHTVPADASVEAPAEPVAATVSPEVVVAAPAKPKESLESKLGARWTVWVGGLALAFGGLFMVKYSIENGLISPALRLILASLFGLALVAAGEAVRRRMGAFASATFQNAMVPGVLTAAGSLTLMGCIFAAHMVYDYLGSGTAFALLALVSLGTVALSLLHGQALAGLGMLAAFATPVLVHSDKPNAWGLFVFLTVAWCATTLTSRLREWKIVPILANLGLPFWSILYLFDLNDGVWPVTFAMLVMVLGTAFIWPGSRADDDVPQPRSPAIGPRMALVFGPYLPNFITMTFGVLIVGLGLLAGGTTGPGFPDNPVPSFVLLSAALALLGAYRYQAVLASATSGLLAILGLFVLSAPLLHTDAIQTDIKWSVVTAGNAFYAALTLSAILIALGLAKCRWGSSRRDLVGELSALLATSVPLVLLAMVYFAVGDLTRDWTFGLITMVAGLFYLLAAEILHRRSDELSPSSFAITNAIYVTGSALAFIFAIHAVANGIATTLLVAVLGFAYVLGTRLRSWSILPWMMGVADVIVLARIGWNPAIVSVDALSTTPFFNALLPGYGIPALLTALAAYDLRKWPNASIRSFLQALASLGILLTIAILVRHAMNGGVLNDAVPTLGEQSIYTLLALGASAVLMTLDLRAPSPVFRWGSMAVGCVSIASILIAHLVTLNPFGTEENTGSWPVIDLLLIAYLLPALAALGLGYYADGKRPAWYCRVIEITGYILLLAWVPLEIRHLFQGANLSPDVEIATAETYFWPICWLGLSFLLAFVGKRLLSPEETSEPVLSYDIRFGTSLQFASMGFAAIAAASLVSFNLLARNPYISGDSTGTSAIFNLLLLGYFAPSLVVLLRALSARRAKENQIFVMALSVTGLVMMLAYVTLVVRRYWQGEFVASWNGFLQGETYTYSVVWLIFGVALLVLGSRLNAISLRLASAAIVFLTVVKVFLVDMSNLEGILRALSFIGLGLVLIAIGMFYQRVLGNLARPKTPDQPAPENKTEEPVA